MLHAIVVMNPVKSQFGEFGPKSVKARPKSVFTTSIFIIVFYTKFIRNVKKRLLCRSDRKWLKQLYIDPR